MKTSSLVKWVSLPSLILYSTVSISMEDYKSRPLLPSSMEMGQKVPQGFHAFFSEGRILCVHLEFGSLPPQSDVEHMKVDVVLGESLAAEDVHFERYLFDTPGVYFSMDLPDDTSYRGVATLQLRYKGKKVGEPVKLDIDDRYGDLAGTKDISKSDQFVPFALGRAYQLAKQGADSKEKS